MKNKFNYKAFLVIYLAVGIGVSGYFYIFPLKYRIYDSSRVSLLREEYLGPQYENGKEFEVSVLITVIGSVLIFGLGNTLLQNRN